MNNKFVYLIGRSLVVAGFLIISEKISLGASIISLGILIIIITIVKKYWKTKPIIIELYGR